MKERPILFTGEMVRAILDGRKTVTRRVVKFKDIDHADTKLIDGPLPAIGWRFSHPRMRMGENVFRVAVHKTCPYGQPGDRLWVRESFSLLESCNFFGPDVPEELPDAWYWADGPVGWGNWTRPKPSIHMPRSLSRITLEVTGVRVERVQDITEGDARREGLQHDDCNHLDPHGFSAKERFQTLWDSLNASRGFSWDKNPWVWVVEFKKI